MAECSVCNGTGDEIVYDYPGWRHVKRCTACGGSGSTEDYHYCSHCGSRMSRSRASGNYYCLKCDPDVWRLGVI